jgi:quinol monooxygenase YgiN
MAVAMILDLPGVTETQYATAREMLGEALQPGNLLHLAGPTEGGWRVMEVWESPAAMGTFFQSAAAGEAFQAAGIPPAQPTVFPITALVADLVAEAPLG